MTSQDTEQQQQPRPEPAEDDNTHATEPRGNPETDQESLRKGEEQLDKVVGN